MIIFGFKIETSFLKKSKYSLKTEFFRGLASICVAFDKFVM